MDDAAPTLTMPAGTDIAAYGASLLQRFSNPALHHRTWQIAMDGSQKLPQRLLGTMQDRLAAGLADRYACARGCGLDALRHRQGRTGTRHRRARSARRGIVRDCRTHRPGRGAACARATGGALDFRRRSAAIPACVPLSPRRWRGFMRWGHGRRCRCFSRSDAEIMSWSTASSQPKRVSANLSARHCEERLRRSNPSIHYAALWIASLRSQ